MIKEDQRLHLQTTKEVQRLRDDIMEQLENLKGQGQPGDRTVTEHLASLEGRIVLGIEDTKKSTAEVQQLRDNIMAELGNLKGQLGDRTVAKHLASLKNLMEIGIENTKGGTEEVQQLRDDIMAELGSLAGQGQLGDRAIAEHLANLENLMTLGIENANRGKRKPKARTSAENQEARNQIGQENAKQLSAMFTKLSGSMRLFPTAMGMARPRHSLLKSLWFQGMRDRQQAVHSAHSKTLDWIFNGSVPKSHRGPTSPFVKWLEHEDGIFWVHGKPGSGKSTLMKFLADHRTTKRLLQWWADHGRKQLVFASHFFWIAGGTLQRSQRGLLRTLLFTMLRDCPKLVPCVFPDRKAMHYPTDYPEWTFQELKKAFSKLKSQNEVRICLFIDGLDEYDPDTDEGSYEELINTLVGISESPNIKICISSRSWYVFKDAFSRGEDGKVSKRAVALEDLNHSDIEAYVKSSLADNAQFSGLSTTDSAYRALLDQIVQKSQGVFLWVFLVVRSVLKGLTFADRVSDLQKRLDRIPDDLNDCFERILGSVDEVYLEETAAIFHIMLKSREAVPLLLFSFIFEDSQIRGRRPMASQEIFRRCDETRRRLDGRCGGLIEADTDDSKVRFIHRTVRDFLENKAMEKLFNRLDPKFDANVLAARSYLALIRTTPARTELPVAIKEEDMYTALLIHSQRYEICTGKALVDVLDEARALARSSEIGTDFLDIAAGNQLWLYLIRVAETGLGINERDRIRLLFQALSAWHRGFDDPELQRFNKDFIACLLRKSTSPNNEYPNPNKPPTFDGCTPWEYFLDYLCDREISGITNENHVFELAKSFIVHGAYTCRKDEVEIILEANHVLSFEHRIKLVELLNSDSLSHLVLIERGCQSVQKLMCQAWRGWTDFWVN